jgi:hypothetical protein
MAVTDYQWNTMINVIAPARNAINVSGGTATGGLSHETREILIGGAADGNIKVRFAGASTGSVTIPVKAGYRYPWALTHVFSTGTTATAIWGFY